MPAAPRARRRRGSSFLGTLLGNGGSTAGTQSAAAQLGGVKTNVDTGGVASAASKLSDPNSLAQTTGSALAGGTYGTDTSAMKALADSVAGGPSQVKSSLLDVANGKYLGGANPYLDDILGRSSAEAASKVGQQFAASGRYGSGRFAAATADAVANVETQARYADYEAERGRQAQAASAIDAAENARAGTAGNLYQGIAGINTGKRQPRRDRREPVAERETRPGSPAPTRWPTCRARTPIARLRRLARSCRRLRATAPPAWPASDRSRRSRTTFWRPGAHWRGIGAVEDQAKQQQLAALQDLFNEQQAAPWRQVGLLSGVALPVAGAGGTSTGTTEQRTPQPSLLQQLLGGGLAIAGTASKFI